MAERAGFVYLAAEGAPRPGASSVTKIGWAKDTHARLNTLQTGNPRQLVLVRQFPGSTTDEHRLQGRFARHRIRGEWFDLPYEVLRFAQRWAKSVAELEARFPLWWFDIARWDAAGAEQARG